MKLKKLGMKKIEEKRNYALNIKTKYSNIIAKRKMFKRIKALQK